MNAELFPSWEVDAWRIRSQGARRNAVGCLIESVTAEVVGAKSCRMTEHGICPDLLLPQGQRVEVKASCTGRWVVYPWRMRREEAHVATSGCAYLYALVRYQAKAPEGLLCWHHLLSVDVCLLTLAEVVAITQGLRVRAVKTAQGRGYHREGYCEGYVEVPSAAVEPCVRLVTERTLACGIRARLYASPDALRTGLQSVHSTRHRTCA